MPHKILPDLLVSLTMERPLLLHINQVHACLPTLMAQTANQPEAAWAGYKASTAQSPMGVV